MGNFNGMYSFGNTKAEYLRPKCPHSDIAACKDQIELNRTKWVDGLVTKILERMATMV
jgi:hypothetical protein